MCVCALLSSLSCLFRRILGSLSLSLHIYLYTHTSAWMRSTFHITTKFVLRTRCVCQRIIVNINSRIIALIHISQLPASWANRRRVYVISNQVQKCVPCFSRVYAKLHCIRCACTNFAVGILLFVRKIYTTAAVRCTVYTLIRYVAAFSCANGEISFLYSTDNVTTRLLCSKSCTQSVCPR